MTIECQIELRSQYAQLTCHGTYGRRELLQTLDAALDFAAENDRQAALVDVTDVEGAPDTGERFELGEGFAEMQLGKDTLVAVAVVGREPLIDPERYGETVALNRCAIVKVFTDIDEAIVWLEHTSG